MSNKHWLWITKGTKYDRIESTEGIDAQLQEWYRDKRTPDIYVVI